MKSDNEQPKYIKTAFALKDYLKEKSYKAGQKLPGGRELSTLFNVSRSTIFDTLELLQSEGVVEIRANSGTYIAPTAHAVLYDKSPDWDRYVSRGWQVEASNQIIKFYEKMSQTDTIFLSKFPLDKSFERDKIIAKCLKKISESGNLHAYMSSYEYQGNAVLRNTLVEYLKSINITTKSEDIILFPGSLTTLEAITKSFFRAGMTLYTYDFAVEYFQPDSLKSLGAQIVVIPYDENGLDLQYLKKVHRYGSSAILVTTTLDVWNDDKVLTGNTSYELLEWCQEQRMLILEIDTEGSLIKNHKTLKSMDKYGNVLYMGSLPRYLSYCFNVVWTVAVPQLTSRLASVTSQIFNFSNSIDYSLINELILKREDGQRLANDFLNNFREKLPARIDETNKILAEYLSDYATWVYNRDTGVFFVEFASESIIYDIYNSIESIIFITIKKNKKPCLVLLSCGVSKEDLIYSINQVAKLISSYRTV